MAIEITDDGATIKVRNTLTDTDIFFNKRKANVKRSDQKITVQDDRQLNTFEFDTVTIPLESSAEDLADAIELMLETPAGVTGINVTAKAPTTASVTNVDSIIVPANPNRVWVSFTNLGTKNVFLAVGQAAVLNNGIGLVQNQGEVEFNASDIGVGDIHAITTGGVAAVLAIQETETTT